ncbi:MAG: hypothetical protein R3F20_08445 [Planctomycetota bacterium]
MAPVNGKVAIMRIGLIYGSEEKFTSALAESLRGEAGIEVEPVRFAGTGLEEPWRFDLVVDRASARVPYYRSALRQAVLDGVRVVGDPFREATRDRFFDLSLLRRLGVPVPETVLLPNKEYPSDPGPGGLRNLAYPLDWDALLERVGRPAWLKDVDPARLAGAHKVHDREELLYRFDRSGAATLMLQRDVIWDRLYRCFTFGREGVVLARYDAAGRGCSEPGRDLERGLRRGLQSLARRVAGALGTDIAALDVAVDGENLVVIDAGSSLPGFEPEEIGDSLFRRVVEASSRFILAEAADVRAGRGSDRLAALLGGTGGGRAEGGGGGERRRGSSGRGSGKERRRDGRRDGRRDERDRGRGRRGRPPGEAGDGADGASVADG